MERDRDKNTPFLSRIEIENRLNDRLKALWEQFVEPGGRINGTAPLQERLCQLCEEPFLLLAEGLEAIESGQTLAITRWAMKSHRLLDRL